MSALNGAQRPALFALLLVAMLGISPVISSCHWPPQVLDPTTGAPRAMTTTEAAAVVAAAVAAAEQAAPPAKTPLAETITATGAQAAAVLVAAGRPDWALYADLLARVAALVAAWFVRPKQQTPGAPTAGSAAPEPAAPPG